MKEINININKFFGANLPFVVYNKPNSNKVIGLFQHDSVLHTPSNTYQDKGFVFAPFNAIDKTVLFPITEVKKVACSFKKETMFLEKHVAVNTTSKDSHVQLVTKAINAIQDNQFQKVVLSRQEFVQLTDFDICAIYYKLIQRYPNAFVYVWFHPKIGLWFGATPETLVQVSKGRFTTVALAGTQPYKENQQVHWSPKEIDEQELVTDYITEKLSSFASNLNISTTETVKAGTLYHLQTKIEGTLETSNKNSLYHLVNLLHPTPAVCGYPKEVSKQFIVENELYERSYYTGFLGELNIDEDNNEDSHLFVNLRCMEIIETTAVIYVGGGITKGSNPEKEWEETVDKSAIMRHVL